MVGGLVLLIVIVAIGVLIWNIRRLTAAREATSAERMKAFLEQARTAAAVNPTATAAPAAVTSPTPLREAQPQALSGYTARVPLLSADQAALYALLKNGLPQHEIFIRMSLAAFMQPAGNLAGFAREVQERRLADAVVDFVVCDQSMQPVAAVQCDVRAGKAAEAAAFAAACVAATGMRWVEISPQALPRLDEIKQRVLGT